MMKMMMMFNKCQSVNRRFNDCAA